jgi:hypothetical protein
VRQGAASATSTAREGGHERADGRRVKIEDEGERTCGGLRWGSHDPSQLRVILLDTSLSLRSIDMVGVLTDNEVIRQGLVEHCVGTLQTGYPYI